MAAEIRIRPADGIWSVRAGGAVLVESESALEVSIDGRAPQIWFPERDVAMAFLDRTEQVTTDRATGATRHWSIVTKSTTLADAAFSIEAPEGALSPLAGHLAFEPSETVTVEEI